MNRGLARLLGLLFALAAPVIAATISDNFESYAVGTFPSPTWTDMATYFPSPGTPIPSATVVATTDAFGNPTQALTIANSVSINRGIFASVPVSSVYMLSSDVRVDQYSDHPLNEVSDFPMQLGFLNTTSPTVCCAPTGGVFASSLTGDWELYVNNRDFVLAVIDFGTQAKLGTWYTVQLTFTQATGTFHSVILDTATGTVLVNRFDTIAGLTLADTGYNAISFFGGDPPGFGDTIADVGTVDNINAGTAPEPTTFLLIGSGLSLFAMRFRKP